MLSFFSIADCVCLEAGGEENGTVEVHAFHRAIIWCCYGDVYFRSYCSIFVVPVCFNIPNTAYVQPSIQSRPGNLSYSCWKQSKCRSMISHHQLFQHPILKLRLVSFLYEFLLFRLVPLMGFLNDWCNGTTYVFSCPFLFLFQFIYVWRMAYTSMFTYLISWSRLPFEFFDRIDIYYWVILYVLLFHRFLVEIFYFPFKYRKV